MKKRANWIGAPQMFNLNQCCRPLTDAFGRGTIFLVGSSIKHRDFRDVDIRCILSDKEFDKMFPGIIENHQLDARWSLICSAISEWLSNRTSLPIDFQIQRRTDVNAKHDNGDRYALGMFIEPKKQ